MLYRRLFQQNIQYRFPLGPCSPLLPCGELLILKAAINILLVKNRLKGIKILQQHPKKLVSNRFQQM